MHPELGAVIVIMNDRLGVIKADFTECLSISYNFPTPFFNDYIVIV